MDPATITALVTTTATALQPFWPAFATKAAETVGAQVPAAIGKVWAAIKERFDKKPSAKEALLDLLKNPDDADLQAAFRVQLKKVLEEDDAFAGDLQRRLESAGAQITYSATQTGTGNVSVQGVGNVVTVAPSGEKKT